jgi:ketosteroid isomerase-like protein
MEEQNIRMAIDRHWAASAAGDQVAEHEIYHDDVVCEYPQSGEIIYGRQNLQALRSHHPGKPSGFSVRRIVGEGNLWVSEYVINYGGKRAFTVSVMEFRDGKVSNETQYFADPFEAPTWRAVGLARAVIRQKIPQRFHRSLMQRKTSNQALERTAGRCDVHA